MTSEPDDKLHEPRHRIILLLERVVTPARAGISSVSPFEVLASGLTVALLMWMDHASTGSTQPLLIPPFAASIGVLYTQRGTANARAWNVVVGQFIGGLSGFAVISVTDSISPLAAGLAVALALALMQLTHSIHPPALGTALLVVLLPTAQGARFLLFPVLAGALIIVVVAKIVRLVELRVLHRLERSLGQPLS